MTGQTRIGTGATAAAMLEDTNAAAIGLASAAFEAWASALVAAVPATPTDGTDYLVGDDTAELIDGLGGDDIIEGRGGDDTLLGGSGNDRIDGGNGGDSINGGSGDDTIAGDGFSSTAPGADTMTGGDGIDSFSVRFDQLHGDLITDFGQGEALVSDRILTGDNLTILSDRLVISVDADGNGSRESVMTVMGDFSAGMFTFTDSATGHLEGVLRFVPYLPDLKERKALDPSDINGTFTNDFLAQIGDYSEHDVQLRPRLSGSFFESALGVYEVEADGTISNVRILFTNLHKPGSNTVDLVDARGGSVNPVGFFLISNGADWAGKLGGGDGLSFIDKTDGGVANISDGGNVTLAVNGIGSDQLVFHSWDASLNPDGLEHVVSGVIQGESGANIVIGFEDQLGGGDMDFQDIVFMVTEYQNPFFP